MPRGAIVKRAGGQTSGSGVLPTPDSGQPAWFVAFLTGSDAANGLTALTPVRTVAEIFRRTNGQIIVDATITFLEDSAEEIDWAFSAGPNDLGRLTVLGARTTVHASTFTAKQDWQPNAQLDGQVADAALAVGWQADGFEGLLARDLALGFDFWIMSGLQGVPIKTARASVPCNARSFFEGITYTVGGAGYELYTLMLLSGNQRFAFTGMVPKFVDFSIGGIGGTAQGDTVSAVEFYTCQLNGIDANTGGAVWAYGCRLSQCQAHDGGTLNVHWGYLSDGGSVDTGGGYDFYRTCSQTFRITIGDGGHVFAVRSWAAVFDAFIGLEVWPTGVADLSDGRLWGVNVGNALLGPGGCGIQTMGGANVVYSVIWPPTFPNVPSLAIVSGAVRTALSDLPYGAIALDTGIQPTQLAGCTMWIRADQGPRPLGGPFQAWDDLSAVPHNMTNTGGVDMPLHEENGYSTLASVNFDGVNDVMNTAAGDPLSDFITAGAYTLWYVYDSVTITTNLAPTQQNQGPIGQGYFGVSEIATAVPTTGAYNFGATDNYAAVPASPGIGLPMAVRTRHDSGNLYARRETGAEVSVGSINTAFLGGIVTVGRTQGPGAFSKDRQFELIWSNQNESAAGLAAIDEYITRKYYTP